MELKQYFSTIKDPRMNRKKLYSLETIFGITIIASICGVQSWEQIALFAELRKTELSEIIDLSNGVPSHDTLERVYSSINPNDFHDCFVAWTKVLCNTDNKLIAIDGKVVRSSYDTASDKQALYLVNAWASENKLVLGQFKTEGKGHEIAGIKGLLELLCITNSIISIDAIGCQKEITALIIEKKADYILAVKGNQAQLQNDITGSFSVLTPSSSNEIIEKNSGRVETRTCSVITNLKMITSVAHWQGIQAVVRVESKRYINAKEHTEVRYYITSVHKTAEELNTLIRSHWGIENSLHWCLDVNFDEDSSRKRKGYSAQNYALTRKIALNIVNSDTSSKLSMTHKKLKATLDINYLKKLLSFNA